MNLFLTRLPPRRRVFLFLYPHMNFKTLILLTVLSTFLIQLSSCRWDSSEQQLISHIFELKADSVDNNQKVFLHFLQDGSAYAFNFMDFTTIELQNGNWNLKSDSLKIEFKDGSEAMRYYRNRQSAERLWTTKKGSSLHPLDLESMESTIFIPADKYGINDLAIPFLFLESTKGEHLLMRLFSSCDYLSAQIELHPDQALDIKLPPRRFESNCPYLERSERIKNQISGSDQIKYEFPDLFFLKKGVVIGHWRAVGGLLLDL